MTDRQVLITFALNCRKTNSWTVYGVQVSPIPVSYLNPSFGVSSLFICMKDYGSQIMEMLFNEGVLIKDLRGAQVNEG